MTRGPYSLPYTVGEQIGDLTVIGYEKRGSCYQPLCRCTCGAALIVPRAALKRGQLSCAPCSVPRSRKSFKEFYGYEAIIPDPKLRLRAQTVISNIYRRCYDKECPAFKWYGARGITVHNAWVWDPHAFMAYLTTLPGWDDPDLELDRRDNEKGYEPGNLRYVTHRVNCQNRRKPKR